MNFSTFRFIVALISAAVFTGRTKVWRLCRSTSPQYHFGAIKVNPAERVGMSALCQIRTSSVARSSQPFWPAVECVAGLDALD